MEKTCIIIYNEVNEESFADELDVIDQVNYVYKFLLTLGYKVDKKGITENYFDEISEIAKEEYDFVFNLVESVNGFDELIYFIPALLDRFDLRYTGCPTAAAFTTGDKILSKKMMSNGNIDVPRLCLLDDTLGMEVGKKYILKPSKEDGSVGITDDSVFTFNGFLPKILKNKKKRDWMLEEYIDGREFNISIIGGKQITVLPPVEIVFKSYYDNKPKIVSYDAKWNESSSEYAHTVRDLHPLLEDSIAEKMKEISLKCWDLFDLHGYARIDVRVDELGNVYVVEVNANPCISEDGGFVAACKEYFHDEVDIIKRIIEDLN